MKRLCFTSPVGWARTQRSDLISFLDLGCRQVLVEKSGEDRREISAFSIGLSFRAQSARIWAGSRIASLIMSVPPGFDGDSAPQ